MSLTFKLLLAAVAAAPVAPPVMTTASESLGIPSGMPESVEAPPPVGTLLLGDSMMRIGVGPALERALTTAHADPVTLHAKSATGLARPDVFDWPAEIAHVIGDKHYQRIVVFIGSNDCQTLAGTGGGEVFGTPAWDKAYRERVQGVVTRLCESADSVVWLGLPPMRSPKFNARIAKLNALLESEVKSSKCAHFVATKAALADGKGAFVAYRNVKRKRLKIRDDDGVHITPTGGELVASQVMAALKPATPTQNAPKSR